MKKSNKTIDIFSNNIVKIENCPKKKIDIIGLINKIRIKNPKLKIWNDKYKFYTKKYGESNFRNEIDKYTFNDEDDYTTYYMSSDDLPDIKIIRDTNKRLCNIEFQFLVNINNCKKITDVIK